MPINIDLPQVVANQSVMGRADFFTAQTVVDIIRPEFDQGISLLGGAIAAKPFDIFKEAGKYKIPWYNKLGPFKRLAEGEAITVQTLTQGEEEMYIERFGNGVAMTVWAQIQATYDPFGEVSRQLRALYEEHLLADALRQLGAAAPSFVVHDASAIAPTSLFFDIELRRARFKLNDKGNVAKVIMAKTLIDRLVSKVNLLTQVEQPEIQEISPGVFQTKLGVSIYVDDTSLTRDPVTGLYNTYVLQEESILAAFSPPFVGFDSDPKTHIEAVYFNGYGGAKVREMMPFNAGKVGIPTTRGISILRTQ